MKNHLFRLLAYLIVLTFLFQPIQTLANSDKSKISDNSSLATAQNPVPGEPYPEQFEKEFEMEIEAERQRILDEHFREEGMPEELLSNEYGSDPQEKTENIPPSAEVIAQTKAQVDSFSCASVTDVPPIECEALVALYESTNGAGWGNHTNWLVTTIAGTWYGVTVNDEHVTNVYLYSNQLSGTIPASLGSLTELQRLSLYKNQLSGEIPPELGSLTSLQRLSLHGNQLSGAIPASLGSLTNLEVLDLPVNQLSGEIPAELGSLTNLQVLLLGGNQLSGVIPPELGSLTNLYMLDLGWNQLSGEIPPELGSLTNLQWLSLGSNQLSGAIPASLGSLTNLDELFLSVNQLSGAIPPELGSLTSLWRLSLHSNQLSGAIPASLGSLTNLQYLYLGWNQLSGAIPPELGSLTNLYGLDLGGNQLSGAIPAELGNLTSLEWLYLYDNQLSGAIPLSFVNLTSLDIFYFFDTQLCEPTTPEFLAWKATVDTWIGNSVVCEEPESPTWLLMYYMAGDNNLDRSLLDEIIDIRKIYSNHNPNMDIAIFFDSSKFDTRYIFYSSDGNIESVPKGNLNSGDGQTLTDFILWARSKTTAQNQALIISDHGHGLNGVAQDMRAKGDVINAKELRQALITTGPVDVIYFMTCLTGNIEFMWELRGLSDYYIAHESISWASEKHNYLLRIDQFTTSEDLSYYMALDYYHNKYYSNTPSTISVINMAYLQDVFSKVNGLAIAIQNAGLDTKAKVWIILTVSNLQRFDERFPNGTSTSDRLGDLFHFASLVNLIPELSPAASALLDLEDDFVLYNYAWSGTRWDKNIYYDHSNARGVAITLPTNSISFYTGEWLDFATGADWSFANNSINNTTNTEGYNWGPMISDLIFLYNPDGADDPIPPDLVAPIIKIDLYLPLIIR